MSTDETEKEHTPYVSNDSVVYITLMCGMSAHNALNALLLF
jgi:hypothetical protein